MENIRREVKEEYNKRADRITREIAEAYTNAGFDNFKAFNWYIEQFGTPKTKEDYNNGSITAHEAGAKVTKRILKQYEKKLEKELQRLEEIEQAPRVEQVSIMVEWKKSRTWGANPTATVEVMTSNGIQGLESWEIYTGTASGWGYDKQSSAIAEACNQSKALIRLFAEYKEEALKKDQDADKSKTACTGIDNRNAICYGFGYAPIPYFEGGVGVECFVKGFNLAGFEHIEQHGKMFDCYTFRRED
jgi:hypothetical protein